MGIVDRFRTGKHVRILTAVRNATPEALADAKEGLVEMGPAAIEPMIACLPGFGRSNAMEVLGRLLTTDTLPLFVAALASPESGIASGVREVLEKGRNYRPMDLIPYLTEKEIPNVQLEPVLLARAEDLKTPELLTLLPDLPRDARSIVFRIVEKAGDPSMDREAMRLLAHKDWWIRLHMAKLLSATKGAEVEEALSSILSDPNKNVRLQAVKSLQAMRSQLAVPFLANVLRDGDLTVQAAAIDALITINDPGAVPHLVDVLKDESEQCRRGAVEVLNEVATTEAIQDLVHALRDADWWVRVRSADALGTIGGEKVVEAVLGLMADDDVHIRRYAVEILNTVPDGRSVDPLIAALDDEDWWVRERSIDALGRAGDTRATPALLALMRANTEAAPLCAKALGAIGDPSAIAGLARASKGASDELRNEIVDALKVLSRCELTATQRKGVERVLGEEGVRIEKTRLRPMAVKKSTHERRDGPREGGPMAPPEHAPAPAHPDAPSAPQAAASAPTPPGRIRADETEPGEVLLDRYKVISRIGAGGFSTVFLVEDTAIEENMILKVLSHNLSAEENSLARFVQELKLARKIAHPSVIRIHDLLEIGESRAISMEYFGGEDLGRVLDGCETLPPDRATKISVQIAEGLNAAHAQGIIHRDVKPANILVGTGDVVKIVDFGLAAATREAENRLTRTGHLVGTPHYMAPELIRGEEIDARADLYSLGVMMYEMLSGRLPYDGDNPMNVLFRHLDGDAVPVGEVVDMPAPLSALVMRLMALDPDDRHPDAAHLADDLRSLGL